jgi:hypothetical protein
VPARELVHYLDIEGRGRALASLGDHDFLTLGRCDDASARNVANVRTSEHLDQSSGESIANFDEASIEGKHPWGGIGHWYKDSAQPMKRRMGSLERPTGSWMPFPIEAVQQSHRVA